MPEKEIRESIDFLDGLLRSGSARAASTSLRTLGSLISALPENSVLTEHCLGCCLRVCRTMTSPCTAAP